MDGEEIAVCKASWSDVFSMKESKMAFFKKDAKIGQEDSGIECTFKPLLYCPIIGGKFNLLRGSVYILNYFHHQTTNAYTEGVHTKMKLIKRLSHGYKNVEVYIKKVLLSFIPTAILPLLIYHTFG